jgi:predicted pyridoxine 5'-phosphate oxidase superfamily flavin-nucleotide-binding protein
MASRLRQIVLTDDVVAAQREEGTHEQFAHTRGASATGDEPVVMPANVRDWLAQTDSFFLATVASNGWPYMQHRGGEPGFVRVLDERRFAFDDVAGNGQMLTVGNLKGNDRVMLFLIDYEQSARLKIWGRASVALATPGETAYEQRVRTITVAVEAWNFNCSAFIPKLVRFD